jgi:hypothetical protein
MAVLKGARGIEVQVICDGRPLQEYNDPDVEEIPRVATRYVEAQTGKAFAIRLRFKNNARFRGDHISCAVKVDGGWIHTPMIEGNFKDAEVFKDVDGVYVSASSKALLLFSNLVISKVPSAVFALSSH